MTEYMVEHRVKVFLVDDHPLVRESLTNLINQQEDMEVCGEAEDAAQAQRWIGVNRPDIAIIDISMKERSGLELIKTVKLRHPDIGIVVLSMHDEKLYAERCVRAGARGYVMKRESTKRIVIAIREVQAGRLCVSDEVSSRFAEKFVGSKTLSAESPMESLSNRELEVFNLLGHGLATRQVADSLHISIKTVQAYCARIKEKLQLSTAGELLREALRWQERQIGI